MPTFGMPTAQERDPRRWAKCMRDVAAAMVAEGWPPKARKFSEVQRRRAYKLFNK